MNSKKAYLLIIAILICSTALPFRTIAANEFSEPFYTTPSTAQASKIFDPFINWVKSFEIIVNEKMNFVKSDNEGLVSDKFIFSASSLSSTIQKANIKDDSKKIYNKGISIFDRIKEDKLVIFAYILIKGILISISTAIELFISLFDWLWSKFVWLLRAQ